MTDKEAAERLLGEVVYGLKMKPDHMQLIRRVAQAYLEAEAQQREYKEAAKRARSLAAAPDYDEEAIRAALWAVVDAVLAASGGREI